MNFEITVHSGSMSQVDNGQLLSKVVKVNEIQLAYR